jgi:site-specific recombinase XerC
MSTVLVRLGSRPVQSITGRDVEECVDWLATEGGHRGKGLGPRSLAYSVTALKQVLAYGVKSGTLATNVAKGVETPKIEERPIVFWEVPDLRRFPGGRGP